MKKIKLNGKLSLNKEVVTRLNSVELNGVKGGSEEGGTDTIGEGSVGAACQDLMSLRCTVQSGHIWCGIGPPPTFTRPTMD